MFCNMCWTFWIILGSLFVVWLATHYARWFRPTDVLKHKYCIGLDDIRLTDPRIWQYIGWTMCLTHLTAEHILIFFLTLHLANIIWADIKNIQFVLKTRATYLWLFINKPLNVWYSVRVILILYFYINK